MNSVPMHEFVGLRPKCYAFVCTEIDGDAVPHSRPVEKKTAKGVKRKEKDEHLHFTHYLDALRSFQTFCVQTEFDFVNCPHCSSSASAESRTDRVRYEKVVA